MITLADFEYGAEKYGTPLYVFDLDGIREKAAALRKQTKGIAEICFAMKANPFLVSCLAEYVDRIEVCSMGEYEICRMLEIKPEKLLISGVHKEEKELEKILDECRGAAVYTVESVNQFYSFAKWTKAQNETIRVYLRLTSGNQFGMDMKTIEDLIAIRNLCPGIEICGIHFFSGTQKKSFQTIKEELTLLDDFIQIIERISRIHVEDLEYGPGLDVPYFTDQEDHRQEIFENLCIAVGEMKWKGNVILEMGRFLTAEDGYYLTKVRDLKTNEGTNYCIVDGGIHQLYYDGQIRGMYQPYIQIIKKIKKGGEKEWCVCGSLCTVNDLLVRKFRVRGIGIGDVLIFQRTGAYSMTEGMSMFLSHSLPKAAFFSKLEGWRLVRSNHPTYIWNMENGG